MATVSDTDTFYFKVLEVKGLEFERKKGSGLFIKAKCNVTGQSSKTTPIDSGTPAWAEELTFVVPRAIKSKKASDKTVTFKLCAKGHISDDVVGEVDVMLDNVPSSAADTWIPLEKRKGKGELRIASRAHRAVDPSRDAKGALEEKYAMGKEIGRGGFSVVYDGIEKSTSKKVAIKCIDKKKQDAEQLKLLEREIDIMKKLKHPNIVELFEVFDTPDQIFMVMEFISGGELYDQIVARGSFTEQDAANLLRQVLSATAYMHEHGIAHRDLKPENLLLSTTKADEIKVADFGLSKDFSAGNSAMTTCCGSPSYVAPEVLQQGAYSNGCDIWSMGVILYVLLSGFLPFYGDTQEELFDKILTGSYSFNHKCWEDISAQAKDLVSKMLTLKVADRPTAEQCLKHPWFARENPRKQLRSLESLRDLKAGIKPRTL